MAGRGNISRHVTAANSAAASDQEWPSRPESPRRLLIHVPVVHTQADMGALAEPLRRALVSRLGEHWWERKLDLVDRLWVEIEDAVQRLPVRYEKLRVFQDGLPVCGNEIAIVTDLARAGSKNHQLLLWLAERGATIVGTESAELLVEEYQLAKQLLTTATLPQQAPSAKEGQSELARALLLRRDRFIGEQINTSLAKGETGIVFLGLLHSLDKWLDKDIRVVNLFSAGAALLK